ncbi:MAG: hypothetical protein HRT89_03310 [Lentisphaeria bacterium]|nr:hypothetical protein [Lentisphaeria bacterium]NQZ67079.1 hypothetical protein [Lentisphaeria bacterium]
MNAIIDTIPEIKPADNKSIQDLLSSLHTSKRRDFIAPMKRIRILNNGEDMQSRLQDEFAITLGNDDMTFGMSDFCAKQLNQRLKPGFGRYAEELQRAELDYLYLENVNELLMHDDRRAQVRVLENGKTYARAVVSDKYCSIDDPIVFGTALNVLGDNAHRFKSIGGNRTDIKTYCKFVSREPVFALEIGGKTREFSAGFMISNSEVGQGTACFQAFFTDSYCNNGLIFSKSILADVNFKHIGSRIDTDFGEIFGSQISRIKQGEIAQLIDNATKIACSQETAMLEPIIDQIMTSIERKLQGDEIAGIRNVLTAAKVPTVDHDKVIREIDPADNSQFGIQAGLTQYAQKVENYEKRIELEKKGADVISMNDRTWKACQALSV